MNESSSMLTNKDVEIMIQTAVRKNVESFWDYFDNRFNSKLNSCQAYTHDGKYYTSADDIMEAYQSITIQDFFYLPKS